MTYRDVIKIAAVGLSTHKSRSLLTILGIVIGISSIILVMSLGQGAQDLIIGQFQSLGPENVFILPGKEPNGPGGFTGGLLEDSIKQKDIDDLNNSALLPNVEFTEGIVFSPVIASYGSEIFSGMILGGSPNIKEVYDLEATAGGFFTDDDVAAKTEVVLIGQKVATKLFGLSNPVGEKIKIKDKNFRVIGILKAEGQNPFLDFDQAFLAPYSTVQQYILGTKHFTRVVVRATSVEIIPTVIADVKAILRNNHNIDNPDNDDFYVQAQDDLVNTVGTVTDILTILLSSVAAISLVVGGIGIMNIMFVSVTERTREIGLRKAIGATNSDILYQFLSEAVILTLSGGVIGILLGTLLGYGATVIVNRFYELGFPFSFSYMGAILGVVVSSGIGFVFGIFPAKQASKKRVRSRR